MILNREKHEIIANEYKFSLMDRVAINTSLWIGKYTKENNMCTCVCVNPFNKKREHIIDKISSEFIV